MFYWPQVNVHRYFSTEVDSSLHIAHLTNIFPTNLSLYPEVVKFSSLFLPKQQFPGLNILLLSHFQGYSPSEYLYRLNAY